LWECREIGTLSTADEKVKWDRCYGKQWTILKKLKIKLPSDPEILLLGMFLKKLKSGSQRDICTSTFTVAFIQYIQDVDTT